MTKVTLKQPHKPAPKRSKKELSMEVKQVIRDYFRDQKKHAVKVRVIIMQIYNMI